MIAPRPLAIFALDDLRTLQALRGGLGSGSRIEVKRRYLGGLKS